MNKLLAVIILSAGLLMGAQPAAAYIPTEYEIGEMKEVAQEEFPHSKCSEQFSLDIVTDDDPRIASGKAARAMIYSQNPAEWCKAIATTGAAKNAYLTCVMYVHEYGHWAGVPHTDSTTGMEIMSEKFSKQFIYLPCLNLYTRLVRENQQVTKETADALVAKWIGKRWKIKHRDMWGKSEFLGTVYPLAWKYELKSRRTGRKLFFKIFRNDKGQLLLKKAARWS